MVASAAFARSQRPSALNSISSAKDGRCEIGAKDFCDASLAF